MILSEADDAANAPPALVVNENVATLEALAATRSVDAMANVGLVTVPHCTPGITRAVRATRSSTSKVFEKPVLCQDLLAILTLVAQN